MKRSSEFDATVKYGTRAAQPDLVVHFRRSGDQGCGPRVGLVVTKSVGSAVERHRVSRRLRHIARTVVSDLDESDRMVIRALPSSRHMSSARLEQQLRAGVRRACKAAGSDR